MENGGGEEKRGAQDRMEKSEVDRIASLPINISSTHLGTLPGDYVVHVSD